MSMAVKYTWQKYTLLLRSRIQRSLSVKVYTSLYATGL